MRGFRRPQPSAQLAKDVERALAVGVAHHAHLFEQVLPRAQWPVVREMWVVLCISVVLNAIAPSETLLKMVEDLQAKTPPDYYADSVKQSIKALGGLGKPLNICLKQEIDRMQKVLKTLRTILSDLKLAIAGTIVMSPMLAGALDSLFNAQVPEPWAKVMPVSLPKQPNIGVWFVNMLNRAEQFTNWLRNGRPNTFWLTGLGAASTALLVGCIAANAEVAKRVEEICFNCWSAGKGKYCALHKTEERMAGMLKSARENYMFLPNSPACVCMNIIIVFSRALVKDVCARTAGNVFFLAFAICFARKSMFVLNVNEVEISDFNNL